MLLKVKRLFPVLTKVGPKPKNTASLVINAGSVAGTPEVTRHVMPVLA